MDPTEALNRMRAALERYCDAEETANDAAEEGRDEDAHWAREEMAEASEDIAEHAEALDVWLSRGGFLPTWWQSGDPQLASHCGRCGQKRPVKAVNLYTVVWTYVANYGVTTVHARNAEDAAKMVTTNYSDDFHKKATVYVFEGRPAYTVTRDDDKP